MEIQSEALIQPELQAEKSALLRFDRFQNGEVQPRVGPNTELSASELMTLSCGVLFFLAVSI